MNTSGLSRFWQTYSRRISLALIIIISARLTQADTYSTFATTRYYSANRHYVVIITPRKRATLYRNGKRLRRVWQRNLTALPNEVFVTNDGRRVILLDCYYGNQNKPTMPVLTVLSTAPHPVASYQLGEVADLSETLQTTSNTRWYSTAQLTANEQVLLIEKVKAQNPTGCASVKTPHEAEECGKVIPAGQLQLNVTTGKLLLP